MSVEILNRRMQVVHRFDTAGIPSRARISPDGRWGGVTAFVVGHAYAAPGAFSTATTLIDMRTGRPLADIEKDFKVTNDGKLIDARDRNYWGLTFAGDGDTFYATVAANGKTWLIQGSIKARTAHAIHENVECPSLSPDGTRIAYKKAITENPKTWRFTMLDLASGKETPLSESRSIDDQLAWLDDEHLIYSDGTTSWVVNADGTGAPQRWLRNSDSPTVQGGTGGSS
jgi:Tol biopolymer transport system component